MLAYMLNIKVNQGETGSGYGIVWYWMAGLINPGLFS